MTDDDAPATDGDATDGDEQSVDDVSPSRDDDSPEAPVKPPSRLSSLFSSKSSPAVTDPEIRERMRTLDPLERKLGFAGAGLTLLISAIFIPSLLHNTTETVTTAPVKGKCALPFKLVDKLCEAPVVHHPSEFVLKFTLLLVLGLLLLYFVWSSRRTLTVFTCFFAGLAAGTLGLLLLVYGGWLLIRSWRLQRYGATDSATVRKVAQERAATRREDKKAAAAAPTATGKAAPVPSKRYTPKSKPRRK